MPHTVALRPSGTKLLVRGRFASRRSRLVAGAAALAVVAATLTGCTVEAGQALIVDGQSFTEQSIQHDTSAFVAVNATTAVSDAATASLNRAQITFRVRHALIAKAVAAKGITEAEIATATATLKAQGGTSNVAASLQLPASMEADALHDAIALDALVKAIPATGAPVQNVTVTAEGVPATSRDEAVALRSKFLADPAAMDAAVAAAGDNGISKQPFTLITAPSAGTAGLFQPSVGGVLIVPQNTGYLVVRTTGRTVAPAVLTQDDLSQVTSLTQLFEVASLLLVPYESSTKIAVNPRYGVWDPSSVQVVPGNDGL